MKELVEFNPSIVTVGQLPEFDMKTIRDEPMLFGCDLVHAAAMSGPITRAFLEIITDCDFFEDGWPDDLNTVFDCRTTLTMPGTYPSLPGWHCDDFNRPEKYGQPRLNDRDRRIRHSMAIAGEGKGVSATQFITEPCAIELDGEDVWHSLDKAITAMNPRPKMRRISNGEVLFFSQDAIHRATSTFSHGWRWFGRMSITYRKPQNEVRKQVQVYVGRNGW